MKKKICFLIATVSLVPVFLSADLSSTVSGSLGKNIQNHELQLTILDSSACDNGASLDGCSEYIISRYKQKNNVYSSIEYIDFKSQYFSASNTSPDGILLQAKKELDDAVSNQERQLDSVENIIEVSTYEADLFYNQALISKKLKNILSRITDSNGLIAISLSNGLKSRISILDMALKRHNGSGIK